ncbi:hypothetical protein LCGC14_0383160 [marine sediment metagenome]|uniref:Uncharacterized protein n=1 Tax=marine sediment metagenome TaxID=412755 RepID=A0A0F9TJS3_9ZZZZ
MTTGWGYYLQTPEQRDVDELGSKLSVVLNCPVHFPAWGKNMFECLCGVIFPLYIVKGGDWEKIKQKHLEEKELIGV